LRQENLQISDLGGVPSRPVSPRPMLNAMIGAFLGFLAAVLYETFAWNAARTT
jgi:uncharacterized protein involved in exopolysaccharide biosynthesis